MKKYYDILLGGDKAGGRVVKPYFCKYLPVEGEIKEGDNFLFGSSERIHIANGLDNPPHPRTTELLGESYNSRREWMVAKGAKKVKLFLCSKDIQVGDSVKFQLVPDKTKWKEGKVVWQEADTVEIEAERVKVITTPDSYCFKVIGEISTDALGYVNEGDEFDEDEVKIAFTDAYGKIHRGAEENINTYKRWNKQYIRLIVKGPCGHFH